VARVVRGDSKKAIFTLTAEGTFEISAVGPGTWGNRIGVKIAEASGKKKDQTVHDIFKLVVYYWSETPPNPNTDPKNPAKFLVEPAEHEEYDNLSWDPDASNYCVRAVHNVSHLIDIEVPKSDGASEAGSTSTAETPDTEGRPRRRPRSSTSTPSIPQGIQLLDKGTDASGALTHEDYKGKADDDFPSGLAGLAEIEDISIVCAPNENDVPQLSDEIIAECEQLNRFAVLSAKMDAGDIGTLFPGDGKFNSKYAAFYYPWLQIIDPVSQLPKMIPPCGHVAGIYARSDSERGVHKAPANEIVHGISDLQFQITKGQQDMLNPRGVNCIRSFPGRGILIWGARTVSDDPLWKYVNVRRLFTFLEKSIERSTQWVVFEPNNERLWARVCQSISDFLTQVWKDGALMGTTPEQAFFVKCDETTMTPNEIETGKLIVVIGVAPARPAEFVIFRLAQWRSGSAITE
jgi:hypothetical protein